MARASASAVLLYLIKSPELRYRGCLNYKRAIQGYSDFESSTDIALIASVISLYFITFLAKPP